ncbi:TetR/AcrR family transcriptional regulator [Mycolicibacterium sp. 050158]|uniref:TetR/AcrR family transcriptional regulator n=1 Tax=Mycolicibacterium sp. 050158 TaxID=3090602 RepID=UPI00299E4AFF|nr:TetR/AcrR family transcriptional regulator [Mycolicibacterium sp. 050158]MDX1892826.1 TetR/AcrR family transcriptional regulator [Mycolicibacterium sp. 050158]
MADQAPRALRADARRNRDAILRAARTIFETDGIFAPIDGIACAAGVGNATLYRNFPTRDDLLAAVIEDGVAELLEQSAALESELDPGEALREWLYRLAWQLRIWNDLPTCIATALEDADSPVQDVSTRLVGRTRDVLHRATAAGAACPDVTADEVFELVTALSWAIDRFGDDPERARHRVDLATAGVFGPGGRLPRPQRADVG